MKPRTYSLYHQTKVMFFTISSVLTFTILALSFYTFKSSSRDMQNAYSVSLDFYEAEKYSSLKAPESGIYQLLTNDSNYHSLTTTPTDQTRLYLQQLRFYQTVNDTYQNYLDDVSGLFFYMPESGSFITGTTLSKDAVMDSLRALVISSDSSAETFSQWKFYSLNGHNVLIRFYYFKSSICGCWVMPSLFLQNFQENFPEGSACFFIDSVSGELINMNFSSLPEDFHFKPRAAVIRLNGQQYYQITKKFSFCEDTFVLLIPRQSTVSFIFGNYLFIVIILFILLGFILLFIYYSHMLLIPINSLKQIAAHLSAAPDLRVSPEQTSRTCIEVQEIHQLIHLLLEHTQELTAAVYQEQLLKKNYELKSLKNQVSPHFLINCLSTIASMANTSSGQKAMRGMMTALSVHLRYTLSTQETVPISKELQHVKNYIELTSIRAPQSLDSQILVDESCENAAIFPSLILMLTENSIKHNLVMGKTHLISITVAEEDIQGLRYVHIRHDDSGKGFPSEFLRATQEPDFLQKIYPEDGYNIGLYNIVKRLDLMYESKGEIIFSNVPGSGARVDIRIPFIPYQDT